MAEIWKDIKGYEGLYQVSNYGNVKSLNYRCTGKEHLLSLGVSKLGYPIVVLGFKNKQKPVYVHRLVGEAFLPKLEGKDYINHKDGNRSNNKAINLEWCTAKENLIHATNVLHSIDTKKAWKASIKKSSIPVAQVDDYNNTLCVFPSCSKAAQAFMVNHSTISDCAKGLRDRAAGYKWVFVNKDEVVYE